MSDGGPVLLTVRPSASEQGPGEWPPLGLRNGGEGTLVTRVTAG